jgi:hypothetical protein
MHKKAGDRIRKAAATNNFRGQNVAQRYLPRLGLSSSPVGGNKWPF